MNKRESIEAVVNKFISVPMPLNLVGKKGHLFSVVRSFEKQHRYDVVVVITDHTIPPMSQQFVFGPDATERLVRWMCRNIDKHEAKRIYSALCSKTTEGKNLILTQ